MDARVAGETLAFERWRFHRRSRVLSRLNAAGDCETVSLGSRALEILALLLERPGTLVSKDAIMDAVWPGVAVEPNNLTVQIAALRRALDEGRTGESCIQTVPGRGYRFTAAAEVLEGTRSVAAEYWHCHRAKALFGGLAVREPWRRPK